MYINTTGLILRETKYRDSSKILTVLTPSEGKITVSARGALRRGSRLAAAAQLLAYSEMTLRKSADRWTLTEAQSVELFSGLREDISLLAHGAYFAELSEAAADEDSPSPEILRLCLNSLYTLGKKDSHLVKAAFETRLMLICGFSPLVSRCAVCGREDIESPRFDIVGGTVCCHGCSSGNELFSMTEGTLFAVRHIIGCEVKKLFSFTLGEPENLSRFSEKYLLTQFDRRFKTLDYLKSIGI